MEGEFNAVKFHLNEGIKNDAKIVLTVTEPHTMIVVGENGGRDAIRAGSVVSGHKMLGQDGTIYAVTQIEQVKLTVKYCIETESDSVLASGILTGTKCS